ncbi:hypothetical protein LTS08_004027 [Lithohypha guttulata]|nr:hypothetical protein LTS08_004027 [Lithohypha guttulata]
MAGEGRRSSGSGGKLASFEKELVCSICTEVLYQPLTILNCLHTFCGSCLKEWFSHQHRKASRSASSSSGNPYTCPTCRAEVKDVQHNATVSNLLELFLAANPSHDRSREEKDEMDQIYKPDGTRPRAKILPKLERRRERRTRREDEVAVQERQLLEEARQRSLQDMNTTASASHLSLPESHRNRSTSGEREDRRHRRRERERQREQASALSVPFSSHAEDSDQLDPSSECPPTTSPRHPNAIEARQREHGMSHQASLRSLVSASESGTGTGDSFDEARIMQEILDEGLLGDIDIDTLNEAEQDALAERIAELYRQRHPRPMTSSILSPEPRTSTPPRSNQQQSQLRISSQSRSRTDVAQTATPLLLPRHSGSTSHSDISRPPPAFTTINRSNSNGSSVTINHRRTTSDLARTGRQVETPPNGSVERPATSTVSASEARILQPTLTRSLSNGAAKSRPESRPLRASETWRQAAGDEGKQRANIGTSYLPSPQPTSTTLTIAPALPNDGSHIAELDSTPIPQAATRSQSHYEEPFVACFRCEKPDIQYEIYKHCRTCDVDLCTQCYRVGKGCKHWFGFGHVAEINYEALKSRDEMTEPPHSLIGRQYHKPTPSTILGTRPSTREEHQPDRTSSNPMDRLSEGHFCNRCGSFANAQFWLCDICNDGDWGFCKQCVQSHHCCTHPLLPVAYHPEPFSAIPGLSSSNGLHTDTLQPFPLTTKGTSASNSRPHTPMSAASNRSQPGVGYDYLFIDVVCDMCRKPIITPTQYYHCPSHETDYDLCNSCYQSFLQHPRMRRDQNTSAEDIAGWRKCPSGHRMIVLAFEADVSDEGDGGMRRIVKQDLVGGWKMTEADIQAWNLQNSHISNAPKSPPLTSRAGTWTWKEDAAGTRRRSRSSTLNNTLNGVNLDGSMVLNNSMRFPPNGGYGKQGVAYYAYWPEEGEAGEGELVLPRAAEVSEIEDINGDWWSGVYAGDVGVFPFGFVREYK